MTEQALIDRARRGDPAAERDLYEAHVERVFRLAYRMAGDEALARDMTQDTFLRAFSRLDGFRGDSAFGSWLHAIAVSVILNGLRKVKRVRSRERGCEDLEATGGARPAEDTELKLTLHRAIDALPEEMRLVLLMHDVEGYKHHEIAACTGVAVGTTKARLHHARARLRKILDDGDRPRRREDAR